MEKFALGGLGKALSYGLPIAGGLAAGAALPKLFAKKPDEPTFDEGEKRLFARHGIDPKALGFYKTLGNLMRGMKMQRQFMEMAIGGQPPEMPGAPIGPDPRKRMSQYA
jgi:hypothetical protein